MSGCTPKDLQNGAFSISKVHEPHNACCLANYSSGIRPAYRAGCTDSSRVLDSADFSPLQLPCRLYRLAGRVAACVPHSLLLPVPPRQSRCLTATPDRSIFHPVIISCVLRQSQRLARQRAVIVRLRSIATRPILLHSHRDPHTLQSPFTSLIWCIFAVVADPCLLPVLPSPPTRLLPTQL